MTDGQSMFCEWNGVPGDDLPFGPEVERKREEAEREEAKKPTLVSKLREEIKAIEEKHRRRNEP